MSQATSGEEARRRIEKLRQEIAYHEKKYYIDNDPQISDAEFDALIYELRQLENLYPELITPESPTQRVGGKPVEGFITAKHRIPMMSIENCYNEKELGEFEDRISKLLPDQKIEYIAELKIDGVSISILYRGGKYSQAITRGDGIQGDDVTANVKTIRTLPLTIDIKKDVEVRGEIFLPFESFQTINKEREKKGEPLFANPRNAASGSIRLLDPQEVARRNLNCFIYYLYIEGQEPPFQHESLKFLQELGFKINPNYRRCRNLKEVLEFYHEWREKRELLDYDVDGIVIKVNSAEQRRVLGTTAKSPRWALAFKFPARQATTRIKEIIVQVGRTGALTPVAVLEPVKLGGVTISRSTLHNEEEIKRKDIRVGDHVLLERSGDVIPHIVSVMKERRSGNEKPFRWPKNCPVCGTEVFKSEGETISRCINLSCPAQLRQAILHFASRRAMEIEGLGQALVDQLVSSELVRSLSDIYRLHYEDLINLERFGPKSARNLLDQIEQSKKRDLSRLIFALGIRHVGERLARVLAERFRNLDEFEKADESLLMSIEDVGPKVAQSIRFFFTRPENQKLIRKLKEYGLNMTSQDLSIKGKKLLSGQTFVITGTLKNFTRDEAKKILEDLGAEVSASVTKKTSCLIAGESPGSKIDKARELGIKIIGEEDFLKLTGKES